MITPIINTIYRYGNHQKQIFFLISCDGCHRIYRLNILIRTNRQNQKIKKFFMSIKSKGLTISVFILYCNTM